MFIKDGIVYASNKSDSIRVENAKLLSDGIIIVTFTTGEKRLFDTTELRGEVFEPLKDPAVFSSLKIDHGVLTWANGDIDCAPEYVYDHSYEYPEKVDAIA
ncbi:MAG: DUF2442 domain-containing protein [Lachnospiraceae bacterium]|nr:DUF2442 domain-containing protein [Lachnospiraceae bacterium]